MPSTDISALKTEIKEIRLLLDGLTEYTEIPSPILDLAISKSKKLQYLLQQLKDDSVHVNHPLKEEVIEDALEPKIEPIREQEEKQDEDIVLEHHEEVLEEKQIEEIKEVTHSVTFTKEVVEEEPITNSAPEIELPQVEPKQIKEPEIKIEEPIKETEKRKIVDTLSQSKKVMNDVISSSHSHTIGVKLHGSPISDIKKAIPINDRFRFQKDLFSNDVKHFNETLAHLNAQSNLQEALDYIQQNFSWNTDDTTVQDFMVLLERKFG